MHQLRYIKNEVLPTTHSSNMLFKKYLLTWERGMDGAIVVGAEIGIPHGSTRGGWGPNPMLGSISNKSAK